MCGINGIFAYQVGAAQPSREELILSRDRMSPRGPDGFGEWWDPERKIGLGHRRLAILELTDLGHQPMRDETGNVVVFNGEIYNYRQIRAQLESCGIQFRSDSDTEVVLKAYQFYGLSFLKHLRGMFAIALWDDQKQALLLARDPFGIKPLYYHDDEKTIRFSSQVKSILAGGEVSPELDPAGLVGFYLLGSVPEPFTIVQNIRCVPAGHYIWCQAKRAPSVATPFCEISGELISAEQKNVNQSEMPETVKEAVRNSIEAHFIADVDVGLFLSAGIDSGALLGTTRDTLNQEIQAVTLGFDSFKNTADDEVPWASKVAKIYGAKHHIARISQFNFDQDLASIFDAMDQPSIDGLNTWFVAKAARESGLKVAISGLGGDELLAGYSGFRTIPRLHKVGAIVNSTPYGPEFLQFILRMNGLAKRKPKIVGLPNFGATFDGAHFLYRALYLPKELGGVVDNEVLREGLSELCSHWEQRKKSTKALYSANSRIAALECNTYTRNQLLRDADWAGMAHSLEIRTPLLDIEFLRAIGPYLPKIKANAGKVALASTPRRALPNELVSRPKSGFVVPTAKWMSEAASMNESSASNMALSKGGASRSWANLVVKRYLESLEALA